MAKRGDRSDRQGERAVYVISVAAELAGVHPQTLRIYERKGLLNPARTAGNSRRYSDRDISRLQMIQRLTQEYGINLAGVKMIVDMENQLERMRRKVEAMDRELDKARRRARAEVEMMRKHYGRGEMVPVSELKRLGAVQGQIKPSAVPERRSPIPAGPSSSLGDGGVITGGVDRDRYQ